MAGSLVIPFELEPIIGQLRDLLPPEIMDVIRASMDPLTGKLDPEMAQMLRDEMLTVLADVPDEIVYTVLKEMPGSAPNLPASPLEQAQEIDPKYRDRPHLRYLSDRLAQAVRDVENGQNRFMRISMPPRAGKQVADSVPVLTTSGWKLHGDLVAGDQVFTPSGLPSRVVAVSPPSNEKMRVTFTDGSEVVCHPAHEWTVFDRACGRWRTVETSYLAERVLWPRGSRGKRGDRAVIQLPLVHPLQLPDRELPVDPYALGVWLGDGTTGKANVCGAESDLDEILAHIPYALGARSVHKTTGVHYQYISGGFMTALKLAGVFKDKHVPEEYLLSSEDQRRSLLAGIVDTDGTVDCTGRTTVTSSSWGLVTGIRSLVRSLGYRAGLIHHSEDTRDRQLNGHQIKGGEFWSVTWTQLDGQPSGRALARKRVTKVGTKRRIGVATVEPAPDEPGRCIEVDSPDGLYLVGESLTPTHNSTMTSLYFPTWILRAHPDWKVGLVSYGATFAASWGRAVRRLFEGFELGVNLAPDATAASGWETVDKGAMYSRGVGSEVTGIGFKVLVLDDLVKGFAEAHSPTYRTLVWNRWTNDIYSRLEPPFLVLAVGCLTGDTPVLMADGSERCMGDLRPGDLVATYENGKLTSSIVNTWAERGLDRVYSVTMESGRTVRASSRHPFRVVDAEGTESWQQVSELRAGDLVRSAEPVLLPSVTNPRTAGGIAGGTTTGIGAMGGPRLSRRTTGASGEASPAQSRTATSRSVVKGSADPTTTSLGGRRATAVKLTIRADDPTCATTTGSTPRTLTRFWHGRTAYVRSASGLLMPVIHVGGECCSSITVTTASESGDSCVTTATSSSATARPSSDSCELSNIFEPGTDRVESVVETGVERVYDIEVDRTHNYIASGLQVSNTRWHEDDFLGRLDSPEFEGDSERWEEIKFPAIAEGPTDILGREAGEPLFSPLLDETPEEALARWADTKSTVGSYAWNAIYQQHPSPAKGTIFDMDTFRYWTANPANVTDDGRVVYLDLETIATEPGRWLDSWDCAFKAKTDSDYVVGQRWVKRKANRFLIAQKRGQWTFSQTLRQMKLWSEKHNPIVSPFGHLVHLHLIEDKANGTAILDTLHDEIAGLKPIDPKTSKESRARAVTPEIESGNVYLPYPGDPGNEWVVDLLDELRNFNHGTNDDQVDALTQALTELRDTQTGSVTVPGSQGASYNRDSRVERNVVAAAKSDLAKPGRGSAVRRPVQGIGGRASGLRVVRGPGR